MALPSGPPVSVCCSNLAWCGKLLGNFTPIEYDRRVSGADTWYEVLSNDSPTGTGANLLVGMLAGCFNIFVTQPLDTVTTRVQVCAAENTPSEATLEAEHRRTSQHGSLGASYQREGVDVSSCKQNMTGAECSRSGPNKASGSVACSLGSVLYQVAEMYRGLGAAIILTTNPAIQYTVFEQLRQWILKPEGDAMGLSTLTAFNLGALAKSIATFVTYPLVRAKVRVHLA
eukprot:2835778-Pyramimonas_sp.AAC.2